MTNSEMQKAKQAEKNIVVRIIEKHKKTKKSRKIEVHEVGFQDLTLTKTSIEDFFIEKHIPLELINNIKSNDIIIDMFTVSNKIEKYEIR